MLHTKTVAGTTLELLKRMMTVPELSSFVLVGGTNLSLRFGHRKSIDIDLFSNQAFDTDYLEARLPQIFTPTDIASKGEIGLFLYIENVKTDLVRHLYEWLEPFDEMDGIRMASLPDVAAMKLSAIARRGVKKDFWDIAELLDHFTLDQMLDFYKVKYRSSDIFHLLRSLVYFPDAESQKDPEPLKKITWKQVKQKVERAVERFVDGRLG